MDKKITPEEFLKGHVHFGNDDCVMLSKYELKHILEEYSKQSTWISAEEKRMSFEELSEAILNYNAKSEYIQASIVMLRFIFKELPQPPKQ